ncbi:MAG: copper resistance system multicopper oxidase [Verrucomicrobiota bacterium]
MNSWNRRRFINATAGCAAFTVLQPFIPVFAGGEEGLSVPVKGAPQGNGRYDLEIGSVRLNFGGRTGIAQGINGTVPAPLLRFREGEQALLRVKNSLKEDSSIHWHGLILPPKMDGVPGVSYAGIMPGETFTYRFLIKQSGTYWYHSHSGFQEQQGVYGPIIIDPTQPDPFAYDREYVVMLSDWTFVNPHKIYSTLKKQSNYYNHQRRTLGDFFSDVSSRGLSSTISDRMEWGAMRMDPTDISDVTGVVYTFLMNGLAPDGNWTGLFKKGEKIRLRFINAGAGTYFDVRIPGLSMTVVQADGQNIQPVTVEEFRIANAETYDVIIEPKKEEAYTIFAEAMDRSGFARGTLALRAGMTAPLPARRPRPLRTMADMGMGEMPGMTSPADKTPPSPSSALKTQAPPEGSMKGMVMPDAVSPSPSASMPGMEMQGASHGPDEHGAGNSSVTIMPRRRVNEPGTGLENAGHRVLVYADLKSLIPWPDQRRPEREIEMHITGNMDRYIWGFDGKTFSEASSPLQLKFGERVRLTFINDTMMAHPLHLHGMFVELENGAGSHRPRKHTVSVQPGEKLSVDLTADALGMWAFHCHILFHMEAGMFRIVSVS